jgi:hypothetical protein
MTIKCRLPKHQYRVRCMTVAHKRESRYCQSEITQVMMIIIIIMTITATVVSTLLTLDNGGYVPT